MALPFTQTDSFRVLKGQVKSTRRELDEVRELVTGLQEQINDMQGKANAYNQRAL